MKIQIENYFGNDVLTLNYNQKISSKGLQTAVGTLASLVGYDMADIDLDDNGNEYIRLQEVDIDNTEHEGRENLFSLVEKLNRFLL